MKHCKDKLNSFIINKDKQINKYKVVKDSYSIIDSKLMSAREQK